MPLDSAKTPCVPDAVNVLFLIPSTLLFLLAESPNLVNLHISYRDIPDLLVHEALAAFPGQYEQAENRVTVYAGHALDTADGHSLQNQLEDGYSLI